MENKHIKPTVIPQNQVTHLCLGVYWRFLSKVQKMVNDRGSVLIALVMSQSSNVRAAIYPTRCPYTGHLAAVTVGHHRGLLALLNHWNHMDMPPRQFSKQLGITLPMEEFIVHGHSCNFQKYGLLQIMKYHNTSLKATTIKTSRTTTKHRRRRSNWQARTQFSTSNRAFSTNKSRDYGKGLINACRYKKCMS